MSLPCQLPQTVDTSKQYRGEKFTYVVDGAKVWCDKSQKQKGNLIDLRPPARGATTGFELKVLDVDTKLDNFDPQTFDICNDGTECVLTQLNDRWDNILNNIGFSEKLFLPAGAFSAGISVALGKSSTFSNAMFPISIESRLICWKYGGVIQIEENGQAGCGDADHMVEYPEGTTEEEKVKWKAQSEQYLKMYGVHPQSLDELDDLFFLTDSRLNMSSTEAADMFFMYQFERSNNLYALATTYTDYYKLGDKYGLGTPEYNRKMEELSTALFLDSVDKKTTNLYDEDFWKPAEKLNDTICNALVEQAIYEINNRPDYLNQMDTDKLYAFTNTIQNTVQNISIQDGKGNISKIVHWERNAFNAIPETWNDLIEHIYENEDIEWKRQLVTGTVYHFDINEDGRYVIKMHRDTGQEAIYNTKTGALSQGNSTFNYGPQSNPASAVVGSHKEYDMDTHDVWYETEEKYLGIISGEIPKPEKPDAIAITNEVKKDKNVVEVYEQRMEEYEDAKAGRK